MAKLKRCQGGSVRFLCPGCALTAEKHPVSAAHVVPVAPTQTAREWGFNGDFDKPTLTPSVDVTQRDGDTTFKCHSFVVDGRIRFLSDSTHPLAGQTVDPPDIE